MNNSHAYRPKFSLLDEAGCRRIHQASLTILQRTGIRVYHDEAIARYKQAGGQVSDGNLVKLPADAVEWALDKAPSRVTLHKRGSDEVMADLSGRNVSFGPGSDCPNYLDPKAGRRPFQAEDVAACARLVDALPQLAFTMSMGIPADVPVAIQYRKQYALLLENSVKPSVIVANDRKDVEDIAAMAASAAGGMDKLRRYPTILLYSEPTTPLRHSQTATDKLLFMAQESMPVVHSPAPMMGGTAPITLAGGLAIGNAEVLSSLLLHQLKNEGAPFVFGTGLHHLDMRTTISVYGAPEFQLARALVAEMGRFYNLPHWGYAGCSDALVMDEQAAADASYQVRDALQFGANLVHDVGYLEAGLTTSPELMVFTAEMIDMHRRFMQGLSLDDEALALDVIDQVGPDGDFISTDHTLSHFRDFWYPRLFERRRLEDWEESGSASLGDVLRDKTVAIMEEHQPEPLPANVEAEIERVLNA